MRCASTALPHTCEAQLVTPLRGGPTFGPGRTPCSRPFDPHLGHLHLDSIELALLHSALQHWEVSGPQDPSQLLLYLNVSQQTVRAVWEV